MCVYTLQLLPAFVKLTSSKLDSNTFTGSTTLPEWLTLPENTLLSKNERTHAAKNYRPIACLNIKYERYTNCLNSFLEHHCRIIEQARGKKGIWRTLEQLLFNKSILKEAKNLKRNICTVWLDYQKAFDSVTHDLLLYIH